MHLDASRREHLYKPNVLFVLFEYGGREEQKDDQVMNETWESCKATPPSPHSYVSSSLHPKSPFYYYIFFNPIYIYLVLQYQIIYISHLPSVIS